MVGGREAERQAFRNSGVSPQLQPQFDLDVSQLTLIYSRFYELDITYRP